MADALALYVHWPFCVANAPIATSTAMCARRSIRTSGASALLADLAYEARAASRPAADLDLLRRRHPFADGPRHGRGRDRRGTGTGRLADDLEITLEANPNSVEAARFADLAAAGINRLSLGLQSSTMRPSPSSAAPTRRDEGLRRWRRRRRTSDASASTSSTPFPANGGSVGRARWSVPCRSAPSHLSLYQLTIEPGTRFAAMPPPGSSIRSTPTRPRRCSS